MKLLIALAPLVILTGCEGITDLSEVTNAYGNESVCNYYPNATTLDEIKAMEPIDSTKMCPDGTAPVLYETSWIVTGDDCGDIHTIMGGLKGINRQFGCWKKSGKQMEPI
jgi:hypothetical protein